MRGSEHTQVPAFYKGQIVTSRGAEEIRRFISVNDQCVPGFHSSKQVSTVVQRFEGILYHLFNGVTNPFGILIT